MSRGPHRLSAAPAISIAPSYTQEFIDALPFRKAAASTGHWSPRSDRVPNHRIGDPVLVWPGNDRDNPTYIGRVLDIRKELDDFYFWYEIEQPNGKVEKWVNEEWLSHRPAAEAIETQIARKQRAIEEAQRHIQKLEQGLQWVKDGDIGFLNRDYQKTPPKKPRAKKGETHGQQAETPQAPETA